MSPPMTIEVPQRVTKLPVDERGYPVPWFVMWIDGKPDFRVIDGAKMSLAIKEKRCWICGDKLGVNLAFVIGPMCAINRVISEPPSHRDCAIFALQACPFLSRPKMRRNEFNIPEGCSHPAGIPIDRNPGVMLLWMTRTYQPFSDDTGVLFRLGEPTELHWYTEGRAASRDEVMESIEKGLPLLRSIAEQQGKMATGQLDRMLGEALKLLPV
jgi:hypothetical protein